MHKTYLLDNCFIQKIICMNLHYLEYTRNKSNIYSEVFEKRIFIIYNMTMWKYLSLKIICIECNMI